MERILSKEEISDLLSAVRHGDIEVDSETDSGPGGREVTRLDLGRSGQANRRLANFDLILDAFARNYQMSLSSRLQQSVAVKRRAIEDLEFDLFLQQQSGRGTIGVLRLDPLRWGGILACDEQLAFTMVEILLGGSIESGSAVPSRGMTPIEVNITRGVIGDACADLNKAFHSLQPLESALARIESNPRLVNIIPPEAMVLVARFDVTIGPRTGKLALVIPHASLDPLREKLRQGAGPLQESGSNAWSGHLRSELVELETSIAAQMTTINLKVRDILNFQIGDVIELDCDQSTPLKVLIEGKTKFTALCGVRKGRKAIRLKGTTINGADHGKAKQ